MIDRGLYGPQVNLQCPSIAISPVRLGSCNPGKLAQQSQLRGQTFPDVRLILHHAPLVASTLPNKLSGIPRALWRSMLNIRHILFPVDFSALCEGAADAVQALAARTGARVTLFHSVRLPSEWIEPPFTEQLRAIIAGDVFTAASAMLCEERDVLLRQFRKDLWNPALTQYILESGNPVNALLSWMEKDPPDLVMLPTHGHHVFRRMLVGSVANQLLHDVACPVWTDAHTETAHPCCRDTCDEVFCALDLSDLAHDRSVLDWASGYARIWNARVHLVHAVPGAIKIPGQPDDVFRLTLLAWARESLCKLQKEAGTSHRIVVEAATPPALIHDLVCEPRTSVVIIGRGHNAGIFNRLGSQAYSIIRSSPCPVISV
jgi:nucleotide-binding universal stress UspA family protein